MTCYVLRVVSSNQHAAPLTQTLQPVMLVSHIVY